MSPWSVAKPFVKRIALINPLGDYGISSYTHELAEGLVKSGVKVDVFASNISTPLILSLPRHYQLYPVLGSLLIKSREILREDRRVNIAKYKHPLVSLPYEFHLKRNAIKAPARHMLRHLFRKLVLPIELVTYLKIQKYDLVWTQWPDMEVYGLNFYRMCRLAGFRIVHTVHNVLPHEETEQAINTYRLVYKQCDRLIVHSKFSFRELVEYYPGGGSKTLVSPHGTYSIFPRILAERERVRRELGIRPKQAMWLFFGGVRPYKNIDAVLHALREITSYDPVLVISGAESGYNDLVPGEMLGRTARLAEQIGVTDRIRFLPGDKDFTRTAELFEAADIVPLPYLKNYGSGILLLAITFGNYIVASRTGGMEEYLAHYSRHVLLDDMTLPEVVRGMCFAMEAVSKTSRPPIPPAEFDWTRIATNLLEQLNSNVV